MPPTSDMPRAPHEAGLRAEQGQVAEFEAQGQERFRKRPVGGRVQLGAGRMSPVLGWPRGRPRSELATNADLVAALVAAQHDHSLDSFIRLYTAVLGSSLLVVQVNDKRWPGQHTISILPEDPDGRPIVAAFADEETFSRAIRVQGHRHAHTNVDDGALCAFGLERGADALVIDLGHARSRRFDRWEMGWIASGMMPVMAPLEDAENVRGLSARLIVFLEGRGLESAALTRAIDMHGQSRITLVVSPSARWPSAEREALVDAVLAFGDANVTGIGTAIVLLADSPATDHEAMLRLI